MYTCGLHAWSPLPDMMAMERWWGSPSGGDSRIPRTTSAQQMCKHVLFSLPKAPGVWLVRFAPVTPLFLHLAYSLLIFVPNDSRRRVKSVQSCCSPHSCIQHHFVKGCCPEPTVFTCQPLHTWIHRCLRSVARKPRGQQTLLKFKGAPSCQLICPPCRLCTVPAKVAGSYQSPELEGKGGCGAPNVRSRFPGGVESGQGKTSGRPH